MKRFACFDIGSGMTKMQIADVDQATVRRLIDTRTRSLLLRQNLYLSKEKQLLSEEMLQECRSTISEFLQVAKQHGTEAKNIFAYATEVFRIAKNGQSFLQEIEENFGLRVDLVPQAVEAKIGFKTALACMSLSKIEIQTDKVLVWDSGGGSFQISSKNGAVCLGKLGSSVGTQYLAQIKGKEVSESMNPVTETEYEELKKRIKSFLIETVPISKEDFEGKTLFGIADHTSAFAVTKAIRQLLYPDLENKNVIEMKEIEEVALYCLGKSEEYFKKREIVQTEMIIPKIAIVQMVLEHVGVESYVFLKASGGCLGYITLKSEESIC